VREECLSEKKRSGNGSEKNSIEKERRRENGNQLAFCDTNALGYWTVCEHRPFGAHNLYPAGGISVVFYQSVNGNILQTWGVR
jgi:hypothetical protein